MGRAALASGVLLFVLPVLLSLLPWFGAWPKYKPLATPQRHQFFDKSLEALVAEARGAGCVKPTRVVVTMSTFEGRLGRLYSTVSSLVEQSCPPDAIYIFLSRKPRTKRTGTHMGGHGDGVSEKDMEALRELSDRVVLTTTEEDWGPGTKLLAALKVERDPSTWLITVDDDTVYHRDTVLALVLAAAALPSHVAPGFWCEEARAQGQGPHIEWTTLEASPAAEGTVQGWCGGFAGVLFKRWFFDEAVFDFTGAPEGCSFHDDVWFGGHLLSKGNAPYFIHPGFSSVVSSPTSLEDRQDFSIHMVNRKLKSEGKDPQEQCAAWFAAFRGMQFLASPARQGLFVHPSLRSQRGQELWVLKRFFQEDLGIRPPPRTFLELGDLAHSKTYFFERELAWQGLLSLAPGADPSDRPNSVALETRSCGREARSAEKGEACATLREVLEEVGQRRVDYMVVDGGDLEGLQDAPFQDYDIRVLQVHTQQSRCRFVTDLFDPLRSWRWSCMKKRGAEKLRAWLERSGYALVEKLLVDIDGGEDLLNARFPIHWAKEVKADLIFRRREEKG